MFCPTYFFYFVGGGCYGESLSGTVRFTFCGGKDVLAVSLMSRYATAILIRARRGCFLSRRWIRRACCRAAWSSHCSMGGRPAAWWRSSTGVVQKTGRVTRNADLHGVFILRTVVAISISRGLHQASEAYNQLA